MQNTNYCDCFSVSVSNVKTSLDTIQEKKHWLFDQIGLKEEFVWWEREKKKVQNCRGVALIVRLILSVLSAEGCEVYDQLKRCYVSTKQLSECRNWQMATYSVLMYACILFPLKQTKLNMLYHVSSFN